MNPSGSSENDTVEESPSGSCLNDDKNANNNTTTADKSKGAIPKTRQSTKSSSAAKKCIKLNNNIEDMPTFNCVPPNELLKRNGYSKCLSSNYFNGTTHINGDDKLHAKDTCDGLDYNFSCLNIPVENDYLTCSSFDSVSKKDLVYCKDQLWLKGDSDSSSDDNELLSVSDDGCIYTYKADHIADLPSSFFNLIPLESLEPVEENRIECNSSPEMDFLEMDFDPGPSGELDSDPTSNNDSENHVNSHTNSKQLNVDKMSDCSKDLNKLGITIPTTSNNMYNNAHNEEQFSKIIKQVCTKNVNNTCKSVGCVKSETKMPWSCTVSERTQSGKKLPNIKRHHSSKGELVSPSECLPSSPNGDTILNLSSFHNAMGKMLVEDKGAIDEQHIGKVMIWTEREANIKQITQIAPSSCGATAVLNVLNALRIPLPPVDKIQEYVQTRFRANSAPLAEYLLSRSVAGCTHRDIIRGLYKASDGRVYSRFFSMYPERVVNLYRWLGYWIQQGAVPIASVNLQKCQGRVPDSWHHFMIFGVGPKGIYVTNPMECIEAEQLWPQLCSESILLVRREDVLTKWNPRTDFKQLWAINDVRWREMNVIGQVAKIVRESRRESRIGSTVTSHIKIPAAYRSGITLAVDVKSPAFQFLQQCPELPLLNPDCAANIFY